jgi:uncharacterized membrane protein YcaP (DUF421 family)
LRISGKRTLSEMNAFDLVVTVALGSTLATILLFASVALAEGLLALALLIFLQFAVTWISVRSATFRGFIKNEPKLLFYDGGFLQEAMRAERMTEEEVEASVRQQGIAGFEEVGTAVLDTDGSVTVVPVAASANSPPSPTSLQRAAARGHESLLGRGARLSSDNSPGGSWLLRFVLLQQTTGRVSIEFVLQF